MELTSSYRLGREALARPIQIKNACPASEGEKNGYTAGAGGGFFSSSAFFNKERKKHQSRPRAVTRPVRVPTFDARTNSNKIWRRLVRCDRVARLPLLRKGPLWWLSLSVAAAAPSLALVGCGAMEITTSARRPACTPARSPPRMLACAPAPLALVLAYALAPSPSPSPSALALACAPASPSPSHAPSPSPSHASSPSPSCALALALAQDTHNLPVD